MPRHIDAWMDGELLSAVGPFLISQVHEDPATLEILTADRPGRAGELLVSRKRQSLRVAMEIQIRELFDLSFRSRMLEQLARWAQGSALELSNHPERRLRVYGSSTPSLGPVRDYTAVIRVEWSADPVPYWEDVHPSRISLSGTSVTGVLPVPGTAQTPVCLSVTPTGGTLTSCAVTVGGQTISLSALSVAQGKSLVIDRDARDDIAILADGVSSLSARSAASADDLLVLPGPREITVTTDVAADVAVWVRGRWL